MVAKNKPPGRERREPPDIIEVLSLYLEASGRHRELLQQSRDLLAAGEVDQARELMQQAEELHQRLIELRDQSGIFRR